MPRPARPRIGSSGASRRRAERLWVADITYVPDPGRLPVPGHRPRRVQPARRRLGHGGHLRTALVVEALEMAVTQRRPEAVIHHSDSENDVAGCSLMA